MIDKTIDNARVGLSKSLMTTPCERKAFYSEVIRDDEGRRLSFPMPERVLFGRAIDAGHSYIVGQELLGAEWSVMQATEVGLENATTVEPSEDYDVGLFRQQVGEALHRFVASPYGLAKMREHYEGLRMQGDNGRSLRADDLVGTPDYIDRGVIDVKCTGGAKGYGKPYPEDKFVRSPEMGVYALLYAAEHNGILPEYVAYQVYVRKAQPEWQWLERRTEIGDLVALGQLHAAHWRKAIAVGDPDLFAVDTYYCGECPFRDAIPQVNHGGCAVGQLIPLKEAA